jgi:NitT/TauT family transport system permease protein
MNSELPVTDPAPVTKLAARLPQKKPFAKRWRKWFNLRQEVPKWLYRSLVALSFVAVFAGWMCCSHWLANRPDDSKSVFLPTPEKVWTEAIDYVQSEYFWTDIKISVFRVSVGFLLAAVLAIPIGLWIGSFQAFEGLLQPLIEFVRYVPVPALIPLLMICFGTDEMAKIMLIFVGTFFQLVLMVADEVRRVPQELLQASYTLGATRGEVLRKILFKAALPGIFDALRLCNGWAWTYLIVAELVAASTGLGYRIINANRYLHPTLIFVCLIILGILGLAFDFLFRQFNARVFRWADTTKK